MASDQLLVLGRVPRLDGVYVATGGARKGILYDPAMGRAIADLVLDRQPRVVLEGGNALTGEGRAEPRPRVQVLEAGQGIAAHGARAVGRPVHHRVVNDDAVAIGGGVDVQLDVVRAQRQRPVEGRPRVLRSARRCAAMGDDGERACGQRRAPADLAKVA